MMGGLARLIDLIVAFWIILKPYCAVKAWEGSVILRFGRPNRVLGPGYYWKIPIAEISVVQTTALQSARGPVQTIGNKHFRWSVKYRLADIEKYVCDIADEVHFLRDIVTANVAQLMMDEEDTWQKMMKRLRDEASEGGFKIEKLRLVDKVDGRSIRLFGDQPDID